MQLIFVDAEDANPTPTGWTLREFGAVDFESRRTFHGQDSSRQTFEAFKAWLERLGPERKVFVSDNPAYDGAPIHFHFQLYFGESPFGRSARRIGDFGRSSEWKRLRITKHDHHPVNDAMGNVEAFARMLAGERVKPARSIRARNLPCWADPFREQPGAINRWDDGRGVCFDEPNGHLLEVLTRPYGSGGLDAEHPDPLLGQPRAGSRPGRPVLRGCCDRGARGGKRLGSARVRAP